MTHPFLITGLPRSRTAWFAALASQMERAICYHEPMARLRRWEDSFNVWDHSPYQFTGLSDSALGFHLPQILRDYSPNTVMVLRDQREVVASLAARGVAGEAYCDVLHRRLMRSIRHPLVMTVGFDELGDAIKAGECLQWLMPGARLDWEKIEQMCRINVQAMPEPMLNAAGGADSAAMLGQDVLDEIRAISCGGAVKSGNVLATDGGLSCSGL